MTRHRKKPRLFAFPRESELANLDALGLRGDERATGEGLIEAFERTAVERSLDPQDLARFDRGANSRDLMLKNLAMARIVVMAHYFPTALDLLKALTASADAETRLYATTHLANAPFPEAAPLVERSLKDPAWTIRKAAARVCTGAVEPELAELVALRLAVETDPRVLAVLKMAADHQRAADGG